MNKDVLEGLKRKGYTPRTMLDIGAHIGTFTQEFLSAFSSCVPTLIEPNPFCLADLARLGFEQHGVAASNEAGIAEMFLSREWLQSTGTSLYRENTAFFRDEVVVKQQVQKARLDDLFPGRRFDFVKIDTQGSEVDVILGGPMLLAQADYILVEVSLVEYNIGGARAEAVFAELDTLGFHCTEAVEFHRLAGVQNGNLLQIDFLFERRGAQREAVPAQLEGLRRLARTLSQERRTGDALLLLDHLETLDPGNVETNCQRAKILGASGETLKALDALAAMNAQESDRENLLEEIRKQMPQALERYNDHLAAGEIDLAEKYAAALAALIPGNTAVLDSALSCNLALGRGDHARKYASALLAIDASHAGARACLPQH